ncbi:hypothetical protein VNI00_016664 [Paramarasmius palmivorus]|uniref:NACHT domain-containing protein n=1 Tax=Paramarasmius palmivorus TaxID=297713 RepID=A0AAW0BCE1_9AGAR
MQTNFTAGETDPEQGVMHHSVEARISTAEETEPEQGVIPHSLAETIRDRRARNDTVEKLVEPTNAILEVLGTLSEVYEIALAAFMVVSGIWQIKVVKSQHEKDKAMITLYDVMIKTYEIAIDKHALNPEGDFSELFETIVRQSEECSVFLSRYMFKARLCQVAEFWNIPLKISELTEAFERLQVRFFKAQVKVTTVAVLDMRRTLESLQRKETLHILKPSRNIFGPKSHCMLGTRRASITKILNWAFHGEQSVLWISGIAGCGKSSLIGTLHNILSSFGFNSRLAAFIRFDRSLYRNAEEFVKALAFLLANFDERFGKPIAEAVERSRQSAHNTDLSTQVQNLLIDPLRGLGEEIAKEGRIVVLVDGIDECSRSDQTEANLRRQLLELFANDKFGLLPFLRIVLASRPEEDIVAYLQGLNHIHHFPLDHTSLETQQDIYYFLTRSFQKHPSLHVLNNAIEYSTVNLLAERASGLFIWAATVVGFIKDNVPQRLKAFTENEPPKDPLHALTVLYETALNCLVKEGDGDIRENIRVALGLIKANFSAWFSCSVHVLQGLATFIDRGKAEGMLIAFEKLRTLVLEVNGEYRLHESFDAFLSSNDRARHWYIDNKMYTAILEEATITCTMSHLDSTDMELACAFSSDLYQHASTNIRWTYAWSSPADDPYQQKIRKFMLQYLVGKPCGGNEFMRTVWLDASRLQVISREPISVKDFFYVMLYDAARDGRVSRKVYNGQDFFEWEIDNIYMSVFLEMAGGVNEYEAILKLLNTHYTLFDHLQQNPIPPVVNLSPEIKRPIKLVSQGKIRMKSGLIEYEEEESTSNFIEWGKFEEDNWGSNQQASESCQRYIDKYKTL